MASAYEKLIEVVESARPEIEKAERGNKAATTRVRKIMQDVKKQAQEVRQSMMDLRDKS